jgi:hypothetical protein
MKITLIILSVIVLIVLLKVFLKPKQSVEKSALGVKKSKFHNAWEVVILNGKHQGKIIKRFHKRTHAFLWIRQNQNKNLKFKS